MSRVGGKGFRIATALGVCLSAPVLAQLDAGDRSVSGIEETIVTARRKEERLQDVPISITVFNQQQLSNRNIVTANDLATYTPSLSSNERFGPDNTAFAIRGFTQELRTTSSVGVYFADVVAPRGNGSTTAGDGAGPGAFFDLQNVQVLKGPQGTLFGRNTTGGAVLITPQKPTGALEGYVEGSAGNFDLRRAQGVLNVPVNDRVRFRMGIDQQQRDGYLKNGASAGPDRIGDIDYLAGRASLVIDLAGNIENYTIASYLDSDNKGSIQGLFACNTATTGISTGSQVFSPFCREQLQRQSKDFYAYESMQPDPRNKIEQWQLINTTTWDVSDDFSIKNIFSYADLETILRSGVFGTNYILNGIPFWFSESDQEPGIPTTDQTSLVEELRFQGSWLDERLEWQAGLYYEHSEPDGMTGSQLEQRINCARNPGADPAEFSCINTVGSAITRQRGEVEFENQAVYAQSTYDLTEALKITGGLRYTWDETTGMSQQWQYGGFSPLQYGPPTTVRCVDPDASQPDCKTDLKAESDEPTWLIGLDYMPTDDILLYAKYARGYRQGSVNLVGAPGFQTHEPEEVDAYEVGSKTSFDGRFPGNINIAAFYNDLTDQQLQTGFSGLVNTTGILNAGKSTIRGVEIEASLQLFEGFIVDGSYTYLDTELEEVAPPPPAPPGITVVPGAVEGDPLPLSPENKATITATYVLPLPEQIGDVSVGATYVYVDDQLTATTSPYGVLPSYDLLNLNLNWIGVAGLPVDASVFATNVTDEEYQTYVSGLFTSIGAEFQSVGMPRMIGVRLRYNFGE